MNDLYTFGTMILSASLIIYIASHSAIKTPEFQDRLTSHEAKLLPFFAAFTLLGLYLVIKYLDQWYLDVILNGVYVVSGVGFVSYTILVFITDFQQRLQTQETSSDAHIHDFGLDLKSVVVISVAICTELWYQYTKHWILNNLIASCIAFSSLLIIKLDSFVTAFILFTGLFIYDILLVFGSDIMVTVAKGINQPIKLVIPRGGGESMLGLGDIVVPGMFIAFCMVYDQHVYRKTNGLKTSSTKFPKVFFHTAMGGYVLGLVLTIVSLVVFEVAQPALLYLCPCCMGSVVLCAIYQNRVADLLAFKVEDGDDTSKED